MGKLLLILSLLSTPAWAAGTLPPFCQGTLALVGPGMESLPEYPAKTPITEGDNLSKFNGLLYSVMNELHPLHGWMYNVPDMNSSYVKAHFPEMSLSKHKDALLISWKESDGLRMLKPLGVSDAKAIEIIKELTDKGVIFEGIPEVLMQKVATAAPHLRVEEDPYQVTYLHHTEHLADLEGEKFAKKREGVEKFRERYPDFKFHDLRESQELFPKIKELARRWVKEKSRKEPEEAEEADLEVGSLERALDNFSELKLMGGAITVKGKVVAFTIGGRKNNWTVTALYEKADRNYPGAYQITNQLFAERVAQYDRFSWIDRQSNAAEPPKEGEPPPLPGQPLKGTDIKMSYHPDAQVKWYSVRKPERVTHGPVLASAGVITPRFEGILRLAHQENPDFKRMNNDELLELAQTALLAPAQLSDAKVASIPPEILASPEKLRERFPSLRYNQHLPLSETVREGFQKSALQDDLGRLSDLAARELHARSTPEERARLAKKVFESQPSYTAGEMPQTKLDTFVNKILGVRVAEVTREVQSLNEAELKARYGEEEVWAQHGGTNLLTRYRLIGDVFKHLNLPQNGSVVDIGSGVGNVGTYLGIMRPDLSMQGYEFEKARVTEAERVARDLNLKKVHYKEQNLAKPEFRLPQADVYYAFNPTSGTTFDKILSDLRKNATENKKPFRLVVAGPAPLDKILAQPWFKRISPTKPFEGDVEVDIFEFDPSNPDLMAAANGGIK